MRCLVGDWRRNTQRGNCKIFVVDSITYPNRIIPHRVWVPRKLERRAEPKPLWLMLQ